MDARDKAKKEALAIQSEISELVRADFFGSFPHDVQDYLRNLSFKSDFGQEDISDIQAWTESAKASLQKVEAENLEVAKATQKRQDSGEILLDFSAYHRPGGVTGRADGWVVRLTVHCAVLIPIRSPVTKRTEHMFGTGLNRMS